MRFDNNKVIYEASDEGRRALAALPRDNIHEKYEFKVERNVRQPGQREGTWLGCQVSIHLRGEDEPRYTYYRNYPNAQGTYDVFRWWHSTEGEWRDYAVISSSYLGFQIIDLGTGEMVAETSSEDEHEWSFCPVGFYVPDLWDAVEFHDLEGEEAKRDGDELSEDVGYYDECMTNFLRKRTFGFVSGTVWGDDWAMKLAQLDLRHLLEGKADIVEKFGYYPIPNNMGVKEVLGNPEYFIDDEMDNLDLATFNTIRLHSDGSLGETFIHAMLPEKEDAAGE